MKFEADIWADERLVTLCRTWLTSFHADGSL